MYDEISNLSRRDFGKVAATVVAGVAAENAPGFVKDVVRRLDLDKDPLFTEISPTFDIDYHALSSGNITEDTAIVCGEVPAIHFDRYFPDIKNKKLIFGTKTVSNSPSTSMSQEQIADEQIAIEIMLTQGTEIIASDLRINLLTENRNLDSDAFEVGDKFLFQSALTVGLTGGVAVAIGSVATLAGVRQVAGEMRRGGKLDSFRRQNPKLFNGIIKSLGFSIGYEAGKVDKDKLLEFIKSLDNKLQSFFVGISDKDLARMYLTLKERDISMPSNSFIALEILDHLPHKLIEIKEKFSEPEVYFFAGGSHIGAKNNYEDGQACRDVITFETIDEVIVQCKKDLTNSTQNGGDDAIKKSLEYWAHLTAGLSFPLASFMKNSEFLNEKLDKIPYSPRAHLWERLLNLYENKPNDLVIQMMVQRLIEEDMAFRIYFTDILVPEVTERTNNKDNCQSIRPIQTSAGLYELKITAGIPVILQGS